MTNKFKVGDRVRCIDDGGKSIIKNGQEYTVSRVQFGFIKVAEVPTCEFYPYRFELAEQSGPKRFRIFRRGIPWGATDEYSSVQDAEAEIQKIAPTGEPFVIVELTTVKAVTVKRVLEAA